MGYAVPLQLELARTDSVAVVISWLVGYPLGFLFDVVIVGRNDDAPLPPHFPHHGPRGGRFELTPDVLRFGLLMADGSKAVSYGYGPGPAVSPLRRLPPEDLARYESPPEPILHPAGGGGGGRHSEWRHWAAPLPPPGPLQFVVEWPAAGVAERRATIQGETVLEAASRAVPIWPDDDVTD